MATTSPLTAPFIYADAPIYPRGFALAVEYDVDWQPPSGSAWQDYGHVSWCWRHPSYPRHVVCEPHRRDARQSRRCGPPESG